MVVKATMVWFFSKITTIFNLFQIDLFKNFRIYFIFRMIWSRLKRFLDLFAGFCSFVLSVFTLSKVFGWGFNDALLASILIFILVLVISVYWRLDRLSYGFIDFSSLFKTGVDTLGVILDVWMDKKLIQGLPFDAVMNDVFKQLNTYYRSVASESLEKRFKLSPSELHHLLKKYREGKIQDINEARRLKELLEQRKREKEQEGDILAAIAIGLLLIGVIALIAYLLSQQRES